MRSFRLDSDSVAEFYQTWPSLLLGLILAGLAASLGLARFWASGSAVILTGIFLGHLIRDRIGEQLQETYPGARHCWLFSVGMATFLVGFSVSMLSARQRGQAFNLSWLAISFLSILAFVIINRENAHVVR